MSELDHPRSESVNETERRSVARDRRLVMRRVLRLLVISAFILSCNSERNDQRSRVASTLIVEASPLASINVVGVDTLSDSASIRRLQPEPDGGSVAFLFADPAKGITNGLGLLAASGTQAAQLVWPDSVTSFWWSGPHQLSFTAGTGQGVRVVIDAHAAQLQALQVTGAQSDQSPVSSKRDTVATLALSRVRAFIDSIRVQPEGTPQGSTLRYQPDSVVAAASDSFAAVHVVANDPGGLKVNPAWYLTHLPSGHTQAIDSLIGRSTGLAATTGQWGADGAFYYAKERSIWRAHPKAQ